MPRNLELENGRIICTPQSTLVANEKATTLSLSSSTEEIKRYFKAILELSKLDIPYPVNLDSCWMLCYSAKEKAVRALKENFIESVDYQFLAQNGENSKCGRPSIEYYLSVSCLEYFIARKVRPVFDVYREVFHKVNEIAPKVAKSSGKSQSLKRNWSLRKNFSNGQGGVNAGRLSSNARASLS